MLKIKPTTLQIYIVNKYFAPINGSITGPQRNQAIPGRATNGSIERYLSRRGLQFVVAGNFITCHSTYGETTINHEEADTLLIHCITSSKLDGKHVC